MIRKKKRVIQVRSTSAEINLQELQYVRRHRIFLTQLNTGQYIQHQAGRYQEWFQGQVAIYTATGGLCQPNQLEAIRRIFVRQLARMVRFLERCHFNGMATAKPAEVRMGQGKGRFEHWVQPLGVGAPLFELGVSCRFSLLMIQHLVVRSRAKLMFGIRMSVRRTSC